MLLLSELNIQNANYFKIVKIIFYAIWSTGNVTWALYSLYKFFLFIHKTCSKEIFLEVSKIPEIFYENHSNNNWKQYVQKKVILDVSFKVTECGDGHYGDGHYIWKLENLSFHKNCPTNFLYFF